MLAFYHTIRTFNDLVRESPFENIVGKGDDAGNQQFLLFPQGFLPFPDQTSIFSVTFVLSSVNAFNLDQSTILLFGKELQKTEECLGKEIIMVLICLSVIPLKTVCKNDKF